MAIITIFLSWDLSHSPYVPSNPYTVPCITAGQGIFFASLFLVMDTYSSSWFSRIGYVFLLLIFLSMIFHDVVLLLSGMFYLCSSTVFFCLFSRSLPEYISPQTCTYSPLLISWLESLAPRPNPPLPLVNLVTPELAKLLITSIGLCPTLKGSLLLYLDHPWCSCNSHCWLLLQRSGVYSLQ